ncbi:hypothetical protein NK8_83020 (plasmid) [Caballeronia sp. NK8]|nr:hypothetical protein NK8_83020 [Caballeronia sp. NK8]
MPMPVVLIGALGGMVTGGVIGLFIGSVMLAVAYKLFWRWVKQQTVPGTPATTGAALRGRLRCTPPGSDGRG